MDEKVLKRIEKRRSYLPALLTGIAFLGAFLLLLFFIPPDSPLAILLFGALLFFTIFFLSSLLLGNTRRGIFFAGGVLLFLTISYYGTGTWLNFLLMAGVLIAIEYFISSKG